MTDHLTPEREAEIRQYVEANRRSVKDFRASLSAAERNQAVLLAEVDRMRNFRKRVIADETENEKFLAAVEAAVYSVLDVPAEDGLAVNVQRLADEVKELRAALAADTDTRTDWGVRYTALDDERVEAITRVAVTEDREDSIRFRDHTNASRKHYGTKLPADAEVVTRAVATSPWQVDQVAASTPPAEIAFNDVDPF